MAVQDGQRLRDVGLHAVSPELTQRSVVEDKLKGVIDRLEFTRRSVVGPDVADGVIDGRHAVVDRHALRGGRCVAVTAASPEQQGRTQLAWSVGVELQQADGPGRVGVRVAADPLENGVAFSAR